MTWFRRTAPWLGIILISLSWRVALHLVTAPRAELALLASLAGAACLVAAGAVGTARAASATGPPDPGGATRCCPGLLAAASVTFLVSGLSAGALLRIAPGLHDIDIPGWLAPAVERVSSRLGLAGGLITFWDGRGLEAVRVTFEGLGLYEVWFIAVGIATAGLLLGWSSRPAGFLKVLGLVVCYALFRFTVLVALAVEFERPDLMWRPAVALASYLPLAPLLAGAAGPGRAELRVSIRRLAIAAALGLAFLAVATFPLEWLKSYSGGPVRVSVLIDETHSDWEWAAEPFDTASFGIRAEYNYYCLATYLGEFSDVSVRADSVTPECLHDFDVLIVKTPTEAYSPPEIDAIVKFVAGGGGLFLVGDHTNLFGMTTYLNAIAERFGMRFRSDDTFDLASGAFSSHVPMGFWTHPVMRGVRGFKFLTSCTIEGGPGVEPIMPGVGLGSEDGDYGHPNFFGNISYDLADRFGVFLQAAARRFGRGRVLLFTDSTCFSNFCMFAPGTPEVARRFLEYLAERKPGEAPAGKMAPAATVLVDTTHSRASFFDYIGYTRRPVWQRFEELYISFARARMRPVAGEISDLEVAGEGTGAGAGTSALAIVNPRGRFSPAELERVSEFVMGGGRLLVSDGVSNSASIANEILQVFRMGIVRVPIADVGGASVGGADVDGGADSGSPGAPNSALTPGLEVVGGEPFATDPAGRVTAACQTCGAGRVVVAVDSYTFSEAGLGRPLQNTHAYAASMPRYRLLFDLLDEVR